MKKQESQDTKNRKVILDTNLWVSFLITKNLSQLDALLEKKQITLVFSDELIKEFIEVVSRNKFKKYFTKKDIQEILNYLDQFGELVKVNSKVQLCRDEKDNFLLNLSISARADFLITGDKDLLVLEKIEKTKIVTFTDFIKNIG